MKTREEMFREIELEDAKVIDRGLGFLRQHMDKFDVQDFLDSYYAFRIKMARDFDYTEWRRDNVCVGMSVEEISRDAMEYCRSIGMYAEEEVKIKVPASVAA
jgi:threonyl-tRNA synthetase